MKYSGYKDGAISIFKVVAFEKLRNLLEDDINDIDDYVFRWQDQQPV